MEEAAGVVAGGGRRGQEAAAGGAAGSAWGSAAMAARRARPVRASCGGAAEGRHQAGGGRRRGARPGRRRGRAGLGPLRAAAAAGGGRHVAHPGWAAVAADVVRLRPDTSGAADLGIFRVSGEGNREFGMGCVYIGIGGARRVQMRCGFRPRDRDRTL